MIDKLNWDFDRHNFSPIQETIIKYFPVENPTQYSQENIRDFNGVKEIEGILNENFFTTKNYNERWGKFKKFLKQELKKPIQETMVAFYPCYSGTVTLKKDKNKSLIYTKELHFFISLLGPYYTILGIDKAEIILQESSAMSNRGEELLNRSYDKNLVITVSPYLEFQEPFQELQKKILEYFPSLKFVPYDIYILKAEGISLFYPDSEEEVKDSVFSALFRPDNFFSSETRGDTRFGFDEWLKVKPLLPDEIKQIKDKLTKRSLINYDQHTLHKVWKLKSAQPIRSNPGMKNVTLATAMMEIIDITDKNTAFIIDSEKEAPVELPYTISDNDIYFGTSLEDTKFKVSKLAKDELVLIMSINSFTKDNITLGGDIIEMSFERYS